MLTPTTPAKSPQRSTLSRSGFMKRSPMRRVSKKASARQREWNKIVRARKARLGNACEVHWPHCETRPVHGHHRLPRGRGGKDTDENCVLACFFCHTQLHLWPKEAAAAGFLLSGHAEVTQ